jgi:hypothetical protein
MVVAVLETTLLGTVGLEVRVAVAQAVLPAVRELLVRVVMVVLVLVLVLLAVAVEVAQARITGRRIH